MNPSKTVPRKILVAMSGGVDSSVAAALLKKEGHDVAGATMRTWAYESCGGKEALQSCCGLTGIKDAQAVCRKLGIDHYIFNFEKEFRRDVMDPFAAEYLQGRTPNPCILCNEHIKFRLFFKKAAELGYDAIATGHYAQLQYDPSRKRYFIEEGLDSGKDQSYVLFVLDQDLMKHLFLPLGRFTKEEIRREAKKLELPVWSKPDSQEICFVPKDDYGAFLLKEYLGGQARPGVIRLKNGDILGEHQGYFHYTRGQRRGLRVAYKERLYVLETHPSTNEVIVGTKEEVGVSGCRVNRLNWFLKPENFPLAVEVKIRSQHKKAKASLALFGGNEIEMTFEKPQAAVAPGQAAVFYEGAKVIGGGWIES